jgi:hypothetical protein
VDGDFTADSRARARFIAQRKLSIQKGGGSIPRASKSHGS